ncbi:uncharacterized protein F5891DRAFT_195888 [Suillus fuscotomentosus]|uniref:Uncharacterized protein n=1 Tax=Suillus fuscotomentosus TaxID=1912939 RepID=A0AAD4HMS6_9AGAM|nr:uncharacterized protein F5891DRAFT_195888 [Suillus fuscotomentosus]KAG1901991.1 hypothetical protein F5891DRAFT_195888 [Suillus fuscotomentosus]
MVERHEKEGTTDSPEYKQMVGIFFEKHVCKSPWPKVMETSFVAMMQHPTVYHTIVHDYGNTEVMVVSGSNSHNHDSYSAHQRCDGRSAGSLREAFFQRIPHVKWVQFSQRHMPFLEKEEDQTRYSQVVTDFLTCA